MTFDTKAFDEACDRAWFRIGGCTLPQQEDTLKQLRELALEYKIEVL